MRSTKTMALVVLVLLVLCGVWFLPSVRGQASDKAIPERVAELEALVADLTERVEHLEQGQVPPGTSFDVLHLNPLADFPSEPSEGDLCVVDLPPTSEPGARYGPTLSVYLNGRWFSIIRYPVSSYTSKTPQKGLVGGIVSSENGFGALIGIEFVREGDTIDGIKIIKIHKDRVEFEKNGTRWTQGLNETPGPRWQ
jgi:hypothetical protein